MAVSTDIIAAYRAPSRVMARRLPADEGTALTYVIVAALLLFVAQLPGLARQAHLMPEAGNLVSLIYGAFLGAVFLAPLMFYAVAALSVLVLRLFGQRISWLNARLALFWSLLVASPMMLFQGMVTGLIGAGPSLTLVNIVVGALFLWLWSGALRAAMSDAKPNMPARQ